MDKQILWVSLRVPYDGVPHAGGKVHNFYLKKLANSNSGKITLLTLGNENERTKVNFNKDDVNAIVHYHPNKGIKRQLWRVINLETQFNKYNRYGGVLYNFDEFHIMFTLKKLHKKGYKPDVIILQWTNIILLIGKVKKMFPDAKVVAIEEDVFFLSYLRKSIFEKDHKRKQWYAYKAEKVRKLEISALNNADLVITSNFKDAKLLYKEGIKSNVWTWTVFFQSMIDSPRQNINRDIIYYGAMSREENWRSALWFINNVMPLIQDLKIRFVILGSNPPNLLKEKESSKVVIKGFVNDISTFFQSAMCMVAPLVLGAGIKIKVLEGLSSGIPVLTNEIGIEGIAAEDKKEFFLCNTPEDYELAIRKIYTGKISQVQIENNAKRFISKEYNMDESANIFVSKIKEMLDSV